MQLMSTRIAVALATALTLTPAHLPAEVLRIAVATNFGGTMKEIAERFEASTGHEVSLSLGSTGKHYAQIVNGAPFDAFFAADARRPELLESTGVAVAGSRFTYAIGRLALWSSQAGYVDPDARILERGGFRHLAIANPRLAPYGEAARQTLDSLGLWERLEGVLVRGENIGQAFQFVGSGNAEIGFVALSQLRGRSGGGSFWIVPSELHAPIEQQAVLLRDVEPARALLSFVRSGPVRDLLREHGYDAP